MLENPECAYCLKQTPRFSDRTNRDEEVFSAMTGTTIFAPHGQLAGRIHGDAIQVSSIDYADAAPFAVLAPVVDGPQPDIRYYEPERELVLTVTASAGSTGASYPVLPRIHGDSYEFRHPSEPWMDATAFVQTGIVTVSFEYRKSLEGFWRDSETETYWAIDNLYLGLQQARRNAPAFGGDIDSTTISGQSAGVALVLSLAADECTRGRIQRTIAMSPVFSLLSGSRLRHTLTGIGMGCAPSIEVFLRVDRRKVARAQELVSAPSPLDPAIGPCSNSFTPTPSTIVTTTSKEFSPEPPVVAMDKLPMWEWMTRRCAKGHRGHGKYPINVYAERSAGNVTSDSMIRSYAAKVTERSVAAGLDVWTAQSESGEGLGHAPAGRTNGVSYCIDIARFFGMKEPNYPFHQVAAEPTRGGTSHMPRYNDNRKVTTFTGADAQAVEGIAIDAWAAPCQLSGA